MIVEINLYKRVALVKIEGRLNYPKSLELKDALLKLIEEGHKNIVIELSSVDFMVSETIRTIYTAWDRCKRKGGHLRIVNSSQRMSEVLTLGGVDNFMTIYGDRTSAVGSF